MPPKYATEDLVGATEVAALLTLNRRTSVSVYRSRYPDFPVPIIDKGRCLLWLRADIVEWGKGRA